MDTNCNTPYAQHKVVYLTLVLTIAAGFCDTVTFVAADRIFSAHVTGNFIVFAYQLMQGADAGVWAKLITFPVFVCSVVIGGAIARNESERYILLYAEGMLLVTAGLAFFALQPLLPAAYHSILLYSTVMVIVFAMGLQNTFSRLFAKETQGPTTIMTGNVTQAALDLGSVVHGGAEWRTPFRKHGSILGGFLTGCLSGAIAAGQLGLGAAIIPGIIILACYLWIEKFIP